MNKLIILSLCIIMISFTSALEFDNLKSYDDKTQTVTITNAFGLGEKLAEIKLNTPINNKVGVGYVKVAEFEINNFEEYESLSLQEMNFYNIKDENKLIQLNFDYKYKVITEVAVNDYGYVCSEKLNETGGKICNWGITGTHNELKESWEYFDNRIFEKGEKLIIGIFTTTSNGDYYEWIPTMYGKEIEEWATWTASLDSGLVSYYKLDESSGSVIDYAGSNTGTNNGATQGVTGKIANAYDFEDGENDYVTLDSGSGTISAITDGNMTINMWVKLESTGIFHRFFQGNTDGFCFNSDNSNPPLLSFGKCGVDTISSTDTVGTGAWHMVTMVYDTSADKVQFFINGTADSGGLLVYSTTFSSGTAYNIGKSGASIDLDAVIDEVGIWNRSLTNEEITQLYNSGAGISYAVNSITLNSPADATSSINQTQIFNCSTSTRGTINNVSLLINGTIDQTNTSGLNGEYIFTKTLPNYQTYNWSCGMFVDGTSYKANNRTITISKVSKNLESYTTPIYEGLNSQFILNVTLAGSYQLSTANLIYNGTSYSSIFTKTGQVYYISKTITVPSVTSDTNQTFYWHLVLDDSSTYNTTSVNQTVLNFGIDNCSTNTNVLYNFTMYDERTKTKLDNTTIRVDLQVYSYATRNSLQNYSTINYTNPFAICLNSNLSGSNYNIDGQIQYSSNYSSTIYANELYHIQNDTINSSFMHQNIRLYDINSSESQVFKLVVKDASFIPVENALIKVYRKYIDEGVFRIVEIPKTDANGETVANLELDDVVYNFVIIKNGVVLSSFNEVIAVCQNPLVSTCEINFNSYASTITVPDYETAYDFNYTLGYDNSTRIISSQFIIPSGTTSTVSLNVTTFDGVGSSVCSDILSSSAGTLTCTVPNTFGNSTIIAQLYKNNDLIGQGSIKLDLEPYDLYGVSLVFLALFVMITLIGAGLSDNPVYTVIFLIVGVILLFALNLIENNGFIGGTATILFLILAIVIVIIKGARRN